MCASLRFFSFVSNHCRCKADSTSPPFTSDPAQTMGGGARNRTQRNAIYVCVCARAHSHTLTHIQLCALQVHGESTSIQRTIRILFCTA